MTTFARHKKVILWESWKYSNLCEQRSIQIATHCFWKYWCLCFTWKISNTTSKVKFALIPVFWYILIEHYAAFNLSPTHIISLNLYFWGWYAVMNLLVWRGPEIEGMSRELWTVQIVKYVNFPCYQLIMCWFTWR